jgi:3-phosphoglycerate kinase
MAKDCVGPAVETMVAEMCIGNLVLLEDLRFHTREE